MVRFENVGLRYGMGPEILKDLSFTIAPQSFQFLTGPSGAGKTTLLRLILLSLKPTRGLISLFGSDVSQIAPDALTAVRRRMGVVFQDFRLLDHLTTFENVALPLRVQGQDEARYRSEVIELLRWVGLGDKIDAIPPVLSGGEKQRAAIARALITRPALIVADEPVSALDVSVQAQVLNLMMDLQDRYGLSYLLVSHDLAVVNLMCDDVLVLQSGRVVEQGPASQIFEQAEHPYTRALLAAVPGHREDFLKQEKT